MKEKIEMSIKELKKAEVISRVINKQLSQVEARNLLNLSYRHTNRLVNKVRKQGIKALSHGNRGKESKRKISKVKTMEILKIYREKYHDFKPTFACEKLEENHQIKISNEKLRQILIKEHLWTPRKHKNKECHTWRERRAHPGELIQIDGSAHRWLEGRLDQEFCLMGFIDDANNKCFGKFYEYEGIFPVFDCFRAYVIKYGVPAAVYLDRHSTYRTTRQPTLDEQLKDLYPLTQFEMAMKELGVEVIHAYSPQAKGRIERSFETHQDRLVKELRLANISTIKDANDFLKSYWSKKYKTLTIKEITEKAIIKAKEAQQKMIRILKQKPAHYKTKKSWMDGFYIGKPDSVLVK